jgi:hypothetical protein
MRTRTHNNNSNNDGNNEDDERKRKQRERTAKSRQKKALSREKKKGYNAKYRMKHAATVVLPRPPPSEYFRFPLNAQAPPNNAPPNNADATPTALGNELLVASPGAFPSFVKPVETTPAARSALAFTGSLPPTPVGVQIAEAGSMASSTTPAQYQKWRDDRILWSCERKAASNRKTVENIMALSDKIREDLMALSKNSTANIMSLNEQAGKQEDFTLQQLLAGGSPPPPARMLLPDLVVDIRGDWRLAQVSQYRRRHHGYI